MIAAQEVQIRNYLDNRFIIRSLDGIIDISLTADGHYQGKIIGGDSPNRTDAKNPDPARRAAPLATARNSTALVMQEV